MEYVPTKSSSFMISNRNNRRYENLMVLEDILDDLPETERAILAMVSAGYTTQEIGKVLGVTRQAISYKIDKCKGALYG